MMPSATIPHRRQRLADSDDEDVGASRQGTPVSQTSNNSKRARLDIDGDDASPAPSPDGPVLPNGYLSQPRAKKDARVVEVNDGGVEKHRRGSIVRVKLTNFVTYTSAEFFPGPSLNMVIGPNGTGKSTLVCAICLGLGWGPQHLGRAKDVSEFVKHGSKEATIEIELAADPPRIRRNPVICRTIKKEGNKSSFTINQKSTTKNHVLELAKSFSIQVDNLCQFLPQDKVCEFAALTPVELLQSTQRAAAGPEMLQYHDTLKKLRAEQKRLMVNNKGDREMLANLENRQETQRGDVERMKERAQVKKRVQFLEMVRPIPRYKQARTFASEAKNQKKRVQDELKKLTREVEPALKAVNAKQRYRAEVEAVVKQRERVVQQADRGAEDLVNRMAAMEDKMKEYDGQIDAEQRGVRTRKEEYKRLQGTISRLRKQIEEKPVEFDAATYNEKIREKVRLMRENSAKGQEVQDNVKTLRREGQEKVNRINDAKQQLRDLESQSGQQEAKLNQLSSDTLRAWRWVKNNHDKFEKPVFGPPVVECSIKEPKYADALESLLQRNDLTAFTVQSRSDFRTLQTQCYKTMKFTDISVKTCSVPRDSPQFRPPMSEEQIRSLGFDSWAIDFLSGPDEVLAMLCSENRLHQTPLKLRDVSDQEFARIENGPISSWVAGNSTYQITRRREYGPGATSTRVRQVRPARMWTSQPVDVAAKRDLQENIDGWTEEVQEFERRLRECRGQIKTLKEESDEISREKVSLEQEKVAKQTALTQFKALPTKLAQQEEKLETLEGTVRDTRRRQEEILEKKDKVLLEKAEVAINYADVVECLRELHEELMHAEVTLIEATSDWETLKERNSEVNAMLKAKQEEEKKAVADSKAAHDRAMKMVQDVNEIMKQSETNPDLAQFIADFQRDITVDQLEADIDSEKARLELTHEGNTDVIKEYEERQRKIDKLKDKLQGFHNSLDDLAHGIAEIRGNWEPALEALIQKISDAFSESFARIGCAGQVSVYKADDVNEGNDASTGFGSSDFDQWAIQIQVKFREHESLSLLDSHRQSGGERAVSTIFYLMALQTLSASPFRVVDEINQGMDPRNERMVHERMVDLACSREGGSQYFLITPKLLSGLVYKRGMKVLCIVSGEYMPNKYEEVDFGWAVNRMKGIKAMKAEKRVDSGIGLNGRGEAVGA